MASNVAMDPTGAHPQPAPGSAWSWSIGKIAGIDVRIHGTFLILLAWVALSHVIEGRGVTGAAIAVLTTLTMFAVVVLHELSHALVARRFGIGTRNITLLPIGGIATLEKMPEKPSQELLVAIAGPALNLVLAALLYGVLAVLRTPLAPPTLLAASGSFLGYFVWFNIAIAVFNMLPAFPMDGGRVLRAALAMRRGRARATEIAARVGQALAIALGIAGIFGNPMLVLIALFVWIGGREEAAQALLVDALGGLTVRSAMVTRFATLDANDSVDDAIEEHLRTSQRAFPVVEDGVLTGVVGAADLLRAHAVRGGGCSVRNAMTAGVPLISTKEPLALAIDRLGQSGAAALPVMEHDNLVGMLLLENVLEIAELRRARQ